MFGSSHRLKQYQKDKIREFVSLTQASEKVAFNCLARNEWRLNAACDMYFSRPQAYSRGGSVDRQKVELLFRSYQLDPLEPNRMTAAGVQKFLKDLGLQSDDILVLVLAWKMGAKTQCEFSREEFVNGLINGFRCDSIAALRDKLAKAKDELQDADRFRELYQFTFNYARSPNQKHLDVGMAIGYWNLVLEGRFYHLHNWCKFLEENRSKPISRDTWNLVLDFSKTINNDFSNYDTLGAWPTLLDEFVEYMRKKRDEVDEEN